MWLSEAKSHAVHRGRAGSHKQVQVSDERAVNASSGNDRDRPASIPGRLGPRAVGDEDATGGHPPELGERRRDQAGGVGRRNGRLPTVGHVDDESINAVRREWEAGRIATHELALPVVDGVCQVLAGAGDHPAIGIDTENRRPDQAGLDERPTGATHGIKETPAGARAGEDNTRTCEQRVHAPGLEKRPFGRSTLGEAPLTANGGPPQRTEALGGVGIDRSGGDRVKRVCGVGGGITPEVTGGTQRPEFVIGILKIDGESTVNEDGTERAFDRLGVDAGGRTDVASTNRYRPRRDVEVGGPQKSTHAVGIGVTPAEQPAGSTREGGVGNARGVDRPGSGNARRPHLETTAHRGRLKSGKDVGLASEFQPVHDGRRVGRRKTVAVRPGLLYERRPGRGMSSDRLDTFDSRRSTVYGPTGAVATSQPLATQAGMDALAAGGNAFDAAVTAAATQAVVEPMSTGIGGDAFALYRQADGTVGALRACGGAPAAATRETVRAAVDGDRMPTTGAHTITVPGAVRGWEQTLARFGERSLADALAPAIAYAREGFPVTPVIADAWGRASDRLYGARAEEYRPQGGAPTPGTTVRLPSLGETLAQLASEGADAFYEGEIAETIAAAVQHHGGTLRVDDLAEFTVEEPEPITTTYQGATVYELPANNQGPIAIEALNIAAELDAGAHPPGSVERTHRLIAAMKRAFHDGHRYITDPAYASIPPLTSRDWARRRAADVTDRAQSVRYATRQEESDTVLITAADAAGNVVSYINSLFSAFGSGLVAGDTGVILQNRGASFSLDPTHPNRLAPGKRPFHTLIPGVLRRDAEDWLAFGVMGGHMQPQGHLQVLSALLDDGASLQAALDRPRWRYWSDGSLAVEPHVSETLVSGLADRGHDVQEASPRHFGGGQLARWRGDHVAAATEPRKDGTAQVR